MVPFIKKLMTEIFNRCCLPTKKIAEAHINYSLLARTSLAAIDGMIGSYIELRRLLTRYDEARTSFRVYAQVSSNSKVESLEVEVDVNVI